VLDSELFFSIALIASLAGWRSSENGGNTPAQPPVDSTILKSLKWRNVGPDRGGRSIAIAGVRGQPKVGYFGARAVGSGKRPTVANTGPTSPMGRSIAHRSARSR